MRHPPAMAAGVLACWTVALVVWALGLGDWRLIGFGLGALMLAGGALFVALGVEAEVLDG